jgi:hypothetical protein
MEPIEDTCCDPLVSSGPKGGVGDLVTEDRFGADPRASRDQASEDAPEAQLVGCSSAVTAQRMRFKGWRDQRLDGRPGGIYNFGFEYAQNESSSTVSLLLGTHSGSNPSQPDERWMIICSVPYPVRPLNFKPLIHLRLFALQGGVGSMVPVGHSAPQLPTHHQ